MNKLVSIIMPVYNAGIYLEDSVRSIINQTYSNFELLICDDDSSDHSFNFLSKINDSRVVIFKNENNLGYLKTCNKLFSKCKGEYVAFQDADDISSADRLEKQLLFLEKNQSIDLVGTNYYRSFKNTYKSNYPTSHNEILKFIQENKQIPFCGATIVFRRKIIDGDLYRLFFDRIGCEDFDLILRKINEINVSNLKDCLYMYRYVPGSISRIPNNFKKFFNLQICFFLFNQRNKYKKDALENSVNSDLQEEFKFFLDKLEKKYNSNKSIQFDKIINGFYNNYDMKSLVIYYYVNLINISFSSHFLFFSLCLKLILKKIIKR